MTVREFYRNVLIELNKEESSSLYVEDFLYYANKAVNYYVNMRYNLYDVSQQLSDDLRVLRKGPEKLTVYTEEQITACKDATIDTCGEDTRCIEAGLQACDNNLLRLKHPYRHLLNCIVKTKLNSYSFGCEQAANTEREYPARRLTADRKAAILNNAYLEPKFYRPYYDLSGANLTIHTGDTSLDDYEITSITVEYLCNPKELTMSADDLLQVEDTTSSLEFPDYVNIELINATVALILEQGADPRLGTNPQVNQSIGPFGGEK